MSATPAPEPLAGTIAPDVAAEFPGLRLRHVTVAAGRRSSPPALVARLGELANRYRGAGVVSMRTKPVPHAFRAFFRQIGLDPDVRRIPSEEVAVTRLLHGGFRSLDLVSDACLVALIETGVPVWALDAGAVDETGPGIRVAVAGEPAPPGSLVVADGRGVHAELFGDPPAGHGVGPRTRRVTLYAVAVEGVPEIHVEEALWCVVDLLAGAS
jgi:DNA/RNA-binding domain of Phe-tRNA-synthetase-like protein